MTTGVMRMVVTALALGALAFETSSIANARETRATLGELVGAAIALQ